MPDPHKIFVAICKWTEKDSVSEWTPLYGQLIYEGNEIKYDAFGRVLGQANFQVPREFYQQEIDSDNHVRYYCFVNVDEKTLVYKEVGYNQSSSSGGEGGGGTQTRFITAENGVLTIPAENDYLNIWRVEDGVEVVLETPSEAGDFLVSADFMMGSTAYSFTFDNNITWKNGVPDFPANETKHLKFEYVDGGWVGYEDPAMSQYVRKVNSNNGPLDVKYDGYKPIIFVDYRNNYDVLYIGCDNDLGGAITNHKWKTISIGNTEWVRICPSNTLDIRCTADDIRYNTYRKNQKGGFCISDATTGNLTIPGAPIYKGEYYQSLTAVSDGEGHNVITVPALTGEYYVCTVAQDDIITFSATTTAYVTKFSFDITVPETSEGSGIPVSFSFSDTTIITWEGGSQPTFGVGTHKLKFECVNGVWYGSYRPDMSEYLKVNDNISYSGINWVAGEGYYSGRSILQLRRYAGQSQYTFIVGGNNSVFAAEFNCAQFRLSSYPMVNFHNANTKGGLLYADATTGNLPAPGAVITKGNYLTALDSTAIAAIPAVSGVTYTYTLTGDEVITFASPTSGYSPTFEVWLTMPSTAVSFNFQPGIIWSDGNGRFSSYNPAPDFSEGGVVYRLVFQYDGTNWLGNLVSVKEVQ